MANYTYDELKHMNVKDLRDIAAGLDDEAMQGYTQMNKDHLLESLCHALNIDMFVHHEVVGVDKAKIKREIRRLKKKRDRLIREKDKKELKKVRRRIHDLKRKLRKAMV